MRTLTLFMVLASLSTGCASTPRNQIYQSMIVGAAIGATYGMSKPQNREAYASLWGGVGAATASAAALAILDSDKEVLRLRDESIALRETINRLQSPALETQTSAFFGTKVPAKYAGLINPGEWRVSRIDEWIEDDENRLIHQDLIMELTPPSLNPISKPINQETSK